MRMNLLNKPECFHGFCWPPRSSTLLVSLLRRSGFVGAGSIGWRLRIIRGLVRNTCRLLNVGAHAYDGSPQRVIHRYVAIDCEDVCVENDYHCHRDDYSNGLHVPCVTLVKALH